MAHHRSERWEDTNAATDLQAPLFGVLENATELGSVERIPGSEGRSRRVYFTDTAGRRWRIYDAVFGPPDAAPLRRSPTPLLE